MSSAVVSLSAAMSLTAVTVTVTVAVSVTPPRGHRVGVAVGAVEVGVGRVGDGAVAVVTTEPLAPWVTAGHDRRRPRVVVGQHVGGDRGVLGGGVAVGGDVVDRVTVTVTVAVSVTPPRGDRVGEAVGAVEVGVGRVGDGAVAVVDDRAVGALGHAGRRPARPSNVSLASTLVVTAVSSSSSLSFSVGRRVVDRA